MRGRTIWAVCISVAVHLLLVGSVFMAIPVGRPGAQSTVNTRIVDDPEFPAFDICLEEVEVVRNSATPQAAQPLAAAPSVVPIHKPDTGLIQPVQPAAHAAGGVAPLHGPITRPGLAIVYVIDRSGSMAQNQKLRSAILLVQGSLEQLGPDVKFQIVSYDSQATVTRFGNQLGLVPANASTRQLAGKSLANLVGEGSSRHLEGLLLGLSLRPDVLILLTDAGDMTRADVARVKAANKRGTAIHAVLLGSSKRSDALLSLTGPDRLHEVE